MTPSPDARTARIRGVGAAAPALRVAGADIGAAWGRGGRDQVAACAPDEDTLTLAWDAGTAALAAAGVEADTVDAIFWGTSRPPFAEGPSLAFLAAALGFEPWVGGALLSGSAHAGMEALAAGADRIAAGRARNAVVVVSDALRPGLGTGFEARCGAHAVRKRAPGPDRTRHLFPFAATSSSCDARSARECTAGSDGRHTDVRCTTCHENETY